MVNQDFLENQWWQRVNLSATADDLVAVARVHEGHLERSYEPRESEAIGGGEAWVAAVTAGLIKVRNGLSGDDLVGRYLGWQRDPERTEGDFLRRYWAFALTTSPGRPIFYVYRVFERKPLRPPGKRYVFDEPDF